jgi:hypothetical protein
MTTSITHQAAAVPTPGTAPAAGSTTPDEVVDVLFPLVDDDEWPPYPAEQIDAVLLSHDLAEIRGIPWFVTNLSRGDIVKVRHDGIGYVGGSIISRGGHSTVHVMATTPAELAPIVDRLQALGATTSSGLTPPMLTVDVPESCSLETVLDVLAEAESMTCAHSVACRQHRAVDR